MELSIIAIVLAIIAVLVSLLRKPTPMSTGGTIKAVSAYPDLNAAIRATCPGDSLLIDAPITLLTSATVTVPVQWAGVNLITISAGQTLTVTCSPEHWPIQYLFTGPGACPGVSFAGNIGLIAVSPIWWGANGIDSIDDTAAINAASAALRGGSLRSGIVRFPRGQFIAAGILLHPQIWFEGVGVGGSSYYGTEIRQKAQSNLDVFVTDSADCPNNGFMHGVQIRNLRITGDKATNTRGSGIHHACGTGELNNFQNLLIRDMPEHGLSFTGNGTNVHGSHLALHDNDGYGLSVNTTGASCHLHQCHFEDLSGDNNGLGLILYKPPGHSLVAAFFSDIKAETSSGTRQRDIIVIDNANGTPVYVSNVSAFVAASCALNAFVRNTAASSVRIIGTGWRGLGPITNLIDDANGAKKLPYVGHENVFGFAWHSGDGLENEFDAAKTFLRNYVKP